VAESILSTDDRVLLPSRNEYDWLGHGIYFWENSPARALEFAASGRAAPAPRPQGGTFQPYVIGAIIDPGNCLDLLEASSLRALSWGYEVLAAAVGRNNSPLPVNAQPDVHGDVLLRHLDCAVIETLHEWNTDEPFDTVRGVFTEGPPVYPGAAIHAKTHVQICVRNLECIRGYFRVPQRLLHEG
jgi:hypothetical protein